MSLSKKLYKHPLLPSIIGEAIFPILGYFVWEWNLFYILMFYAADILANIVFTAIKQKWIVFPPDKVIANKIDRQDLVRGIYISTFTGMLTLLIFFSSITGAFILLQNNVIDWEALVMRFLKEEFLIVLILPLARWMEFGFFFKMRRQYLTITHKVFLRNFLKHQALLLAFSGLAVLLAVFQTPEIFIICLGVLLKLGFDIFRLNMTLR